MKKDFFAVALALALALAASAQPTQPTKEAQEVQFLTVTPMTYAYLECSGPYSQFQQKIGEFMEAFFSQQLASSGFFFGIYFNSPDMVKSEAELQWGIGMPVAPNAKVAAPLKLGEYPGGSVAVCTHVGPYDKVADTYKKLMEHIGKSGYRVAGPIMEKYLDNPQVIDSKSLRTEIVVPVEPVK